MLCCRFCTSVALPFAPSTCVQFHESGQGYRPVLMANEFWLLRDMTVELNSSTTEVQLEMTYESLCTCYYLVRLHNLSATVCVCVGGQSYKALHCSATSTRPRMVRWCLRVRTFG